MLKHWQLALSSLVLVISVLNIGYLAFRLHLLGAFPAISWVTISLQTIAVINISCMLLYKGMRVVVFSPPFPSIRLYRRDIGNIFQIRKCRYCFGVSQVDLVISEFPLKESEIRVTHLCRKHFFTTALKLKLQRPDATMESTGHLPRWWLKSELSSEIAE